MKVKKETIADRLNFIKNLKGITQSEICRLCGFTQPRVSSYFLGTRIPTDTAIVSMCEILNVSPTWLRDGKGSHDDYFDKEKYLVDDFSIAYIDRDSSFEFKPMSEGRLMFNCVLSKKETEKLSKIFSQNT